MAHATSPHLFNFGQIRNADVRNLFLKLLERRLGEDVMHLRRQKTVRAAVSSPTAQLKKRSCRTFVVKCPAPSQNSVSSGGFFVPSAFGAS